jgi:prepilin signal peptidase PulO-like enzyme (type II secretory pathway)
VARPGIIDAVMSAAAHTHQTVYDVLVGLHVLAAVIGFGAVAISGVYGATAARPDRPGAVQETERYFQSRGRAELLVLVVPWIGAGALAFRPQGADFGAVWVVAAAVIWLMASALLLLVVRPAEAALRNGGGADAGRRLKWGAAAVDLCFVAALVLMIGQPA